MWRRMKISGLMMLILAFVPGINERFPVLEAIEHGFIQIESIRIGDQLGSVIEMKIHPKKSNKIQLVVPAGTHFISKDESEQDVVVVTDRDAIVSGHTVAHIVYQ